MCPLSKKDDVNNLGKDYGHMLPVRLLTEHAINKYAKQVDAKIRTTLKAQSRMWNVDWCGEALERIVKDSASGADLSTAISGEARLKTAWEAAWSHVANMLRDRLGLELDASFQAAEWEEPIKMILQRLYPKADVYSVAGPREAGADLIVRIPNCFGELPWLIVVQVKNYQGEIDTAVLKQLRDAHNRYSKDGEVISLVVMTTAEKASADFRSRADALSKELRTQIRVVLRKEMMKILLDGLLTRI